MSCYSSYCPYAGLSVPRITVPVESLEQFLGGLPRGAQQVFVDDPLRPSGRLRWGRGKEPRALQREVGGDTKHHGVRDQTRPVVV